MAFPVKDCAIIIPAYNAAATIAETLQSIQALPVGLERLHAVMVADDCSTDDSMAVAQANWHSSVPLQCVRNEKNKGERATINDAVARLPAHVRWFYILHADDLALPNWMEVFGRAMDAAGDRVAALTASYDVLYPDGRIEPGENKGEERKEKIAGTPESIRHTLFAGCWFKISSCCIRVDAFRSVGGFMPDMPQLGDWEFTLRLFREDWGIDYVPLCLSVYRQLPQSVSSISFRTHRDVREGLLILSMYRAFLSPMDLVRRHGYYAGQLSRRVAASLLRGDTTRLSSALALYPSLLRNGLACLTSR
jgi:GT2 family glycosyltransferase